MKKIFAVFFISAAVITVSGAGYSGMLPDIEAEFAAQRKEIKISPPAGSEEFERQNKNQLKPAPLSDDSYIDIVIKRDKTSEYENDVKSVIIILEKMRKCLNTDRSIQMFNAAASNLIDNIDYIRRKYQNKDESSSASYNKMLMLSMQTRETASFWTLGLGVLKYKPYTSPDNIYTKENLDRKLESLLEEINDTLFLLKNT